MIVKELEKLIKQWHEMVQFVIDEGMKSNPEAGADYWNGVSMGFGICSKELENLVIVSRMKNES